MKVCHWQLLLRLFSREGKLTDEEKQVLSEDKDLVRFNSTLDKLIQNRETQSSPRSDTELWKLLKTRIESSEAETKSLHTHLYPRHHHTHTFLRYAAVIVIGIGLAFFTTERFSKWPWIKQKEVVKLNQVQVKPMQRLHIRLNDGTKVLLDAGSRLSYPEHFGEQREVILSGEAFFEVAYDAEHPFVVKSGHANIEVLGTKFNVRHWQESEKIAVVVSEGKVKLRSTNDNYDFVILTKGLRSTLSDKNKLTFPESVNTEEYLRWMHNEKIFRNVPVIEVLAQLERWYGYQFTLADSGIGRQKITVELKATNVNSVLELISMVTHTKIVQESNHIELIPLLNKKQ